MDTNFFARIDHEALKRERRGNMRRMALKAREARDPFMREHYLYVAKLWRYLDNQAAETKLPWLR
jgi:hypothetical protein